MARKAAKKGYKVDTAKKIITIYSNVEQSAADKEDIQLYVSAGYVIKRAKRAATVEEMRDALKAADPKAAEEFDKLYEMKKVVIDGKEELGFHAAVKFYNNWKKEQEKKAK